MMNFRHFNRSLVVVAAFAVCAVEAAAQDPPLSVQKLLERGALDEAVQRAEGERDNPESTYLAAQAFTKMSNNERAAEEFSRLRETGDESWKAIGESGVLLTNGDADGAMEAASRAVAANGDNPYGHYQIGLVASRQGNYDRALEAFSRAVELKPDLAYAHYYAGIASQRLKQMARMSEHFEIFLKLAPEAPERTAVAAILRTLRPR
ncbi:MAG TPA: tetratricopeptide repeat protein [Vicinamibacterales bacterium]|nr:tetratricopeptide repeat protein [Vicinamibacterales bacterium]